MEPTIASAAMLMLGVAASAGESRDAWEYQESDSNDLETLESEFHQRLTSHPETEND